VAVGDLPGLVAAHRRGDEGVVLSLPQVNLGFDLGQGKPPGPAEQHHIAGGALAALAERLGDVGDEDLADFGAADDLGIGG